MKASAGAPEKPRQPGKIRAVILALAVHAVFFALIVFGVTWQSRPTPPLQAELWDKLPPGKAASAPEPAKPEPPPKPEPAKTEPPPKPEPAKPEPPKPDPPKAEPRPEPPKPDPAIAERKEREKKEREKKEREKKELERKEQERRDLERKEREARAAAAASAKAAEAKAAAEARAKAAEAKAAAEAAAAARDAEVRSYVDRIRAKIRGKANVPDTVTGTPEVQVRITILPGGDVLDIVVVKSSGNRLYDTAIERAIRSAQPLPVPTNPELFGQFRSLTLNIRHER